MTTVISPNPDITENVAQFVGTIIWHDHRKRPPREFVAVMCPDDEEGGFSIFALNYPGVISEGETAEEAKANIAEAFLGMLEARQKHGEEMQFSRATDIPAGAVHVWIKADGKDAPANGR